MKIINLTQHAATPDQIEAGVVEPYNKADVQEQLTFNQIPESEELAETALYLAQMAVHQGADAAMIGGAPYLMAPLERALLVFNIQPLYSFSVRESVEEVQADGSVAKRNVFRHAGWVEV